MFVEVDAAYALGQSALRSLGLAKDEAAVTTHHLVDCELRGLSYSGLARILSIQERLQDQGTPVQEITITKESPVSAQIDGGDKLGYVVARRAVEVVIEKASTVGMAVVGANNTWYTGMLSYYAEMITAKGLVAMIASNATPWVAPYGGTEGRFGTNPFCFGFPSQATPVIWDIGISDIIHAQAVLAARTGQKLPPGVAYDHLGNPTEDPVEALGGAFTSWGGHKGSGLGICVQLLGVLAGSPISPLPLRDFGFFVFAMRPDLLGAGDGFAASVSEFGEAIRSTRRLNETIPVRMPFEGSDARRKKNLSAGGFDIDAAILEAVTALARK
ncbi:MAG: Ldh family oxidoreductase [Arthrobacter sp.]